MDSVKKGIFTKKKNLINGLKFPEESKSFVRASILSEKVSLCKGGEPSPPPSRKGLVPATCARYKKQSLRSHFLLDTQGTRALLSIHWPALFSWVRVANS